MSELLQRVKASLRFRLRRFLTGEPMWVVIAKDRAVDRFIATLDPTTLSAVEVSGHANARHGFKEFVTLTYPEFDVCVGGDVGTFDIVFCEQVLEHVPDPWAAMRVLASLAKPGGHVVVSTPFLLRIHPHPEDFWRFTPDALLLLAAGADLDVIETGSWGNESAVRANLGMWRRYRPWHSLANQENIAINCWLFARVPSEPVQG
jgi:SAM-dependent methyltransferase